MGTLPPSAQLKINKLLQEIAAILDTGRCDRPQASRTPKGNIMEKSDLVVLGRLHWTDVRLNTAELRRVLRAKDILEEKYCHQYTKSQFAKALLLNTCDQIVAEEEE